MTVVGHLNQSLLCFSQEKKTWPFFIDHSWPYYKWAGTKAMFLHDCSWPYKKQAIIYISQGMEPRPCFYMTVVGHIKIRQQYI